MKRFFKSFHKFLYALHLSALRRPKTVLAIYSLFFVWGLGAAGNLHFLISIDDLIDRDFTSYARLQNTKENFNDQNNLFLILSKKDQTFNKDEICDLKIALQTFTDSTQIVSRISSTFGVRAVDWKDGHLRFPDLFNVNCARRVDPETDLISNGFKGLRESPWENILISAKQDDLTLSFYIRDKENLKTGRFDIKDVEEVQNYFQEHFFKTHPEVNSTWGGTAAFQYHLRKAYDQTQALNGLMLILTLLFFKWFFRSWKSGFLFSWTIILATVPLYGLMATFHTPIDSLTNAIPLMVIISCLQDFVFFAYLLTKRPGQWRWAMRKVIVPSFYTSLTTAVGFGSLAFSDLSLIARFGAWSAFGGMLEWSIIFIYLPAVFTTFKKAQLNTLSFRPTLQTAMNALKKFSIPRWLAYALLACFPIALMGIHSLEVADSPEGMFRKSHIVRQTSEQIQKWRGWSAETSLIFNEEEPDKNRKIIAELKKHSHVAEIEDPYAVEDYLKKDLKDYQGNFVTSLWEDSNYSRRLVSHSGERRAIVYLNSTELKDLKALEDYVDRDLCKKGECYLSSSLMSYVEFGERVLSTLMESLLGSLVIVSIILFCLARFLRIKNITAALVSAMWGPMALITMFVLFRIPIFYVTSICASVLVGLAGDNTIQFIFARKRNLRSGMDEFAPASFLISVGMCSLCFVFFLSVFEPLLKLGLLMIAGFVMILFGDIYILKGLLGDEKKPGN